MEPEASLVAVPRQLHISAAESLLQALTQTWLLTTGARPADLPTDLERCRTWFDPVAQGHRLRRELGDLPVLPADVADPGEPLVITVGQGRRLVTPEGRCALDLLANLPRNVETHVISDVQLLPYDRMLAQTYRDWSRHRLQSVVQLLAGTTKPLQIPAAGVVLALLVDRCTSEERALIRYSSEERRNVVDRAFFRVVNAFSDVLAPSTRRKRDQHLISGWMLYEARRRLGENLVVVDARAGSDGKVWVREEGEADVVRAIARDLVRGHRARATPEGLEAAFDALVDTLRGELPRLAGFGLAHERPPNTKRLRANLIESLMSYVEQGDDAAGDLAS